MDYSVAGVFNGVSLSCRNSDTVVELPLTKTHSRPHALLTMAVAMHRESRLLMPE